MVRLALSLVARAYDEPHGVCSVRRARRRPYGACWRAAPRVEGCRVHAAGLCLGCGLWSPARGPLQSAGSERNWGWGGRDLMVGAPGDAASHTRGACRGRRDSASHERFVVEAEQGLQGHTEGPCQADDSLNGHLGRLWALLNPRDGDIREPGTLREGFLRQPLAPPEVSQALRPA